MTQEQYNRAVEIGERLKKLNQAKSSITSGLCTLGYVCLVSPTDTGKINIAMDSYLNALPDILDRHDKMIREEIDSEIEKLKKEIEEL